MELTKKYKSPPLIEVISEFSFSDEGESLSEIDKSFGKLVKEYFPIRRERKDLSFIIKQNDSLEIPEVKQEEIHGLIQYVNNEGNLMAQIGNNLLAINHLRPYKSWEDFVPIILQNLEVYQSCSKKNLINRISVRYINKVDIPVEDLKISDYFNYAISVPEGVSQNLANILIQTEHVYANNEILVLTLHNTPPENEHKVSFIFDITYNYLNINEVGIKNVKNLLNNAHLRLNEVFEKSLKDKCKEIFEL